jgi:chromosome partitioning protein
MTTVITFINEKGGVGKTTTATTTATLLAKMGHSTCIIDTDTQGHVAERLKLRPENGFFSLIDGADWQDVLRGVAPAYYGGKTESPKLWVVPGYDATRKLDENFEAKNFADRLDETQNEFDFIIIDTSPKLGAIHAALYAVSNYVIIPTECTRLSVKGVISTINHIKQAEPHANQSGFSIAKILGIVPTKFNGTKKVHYQNLGWIGGRYGDEILFPPVKFLTDWEKAESMQIPVYMYNSRSEAASDARTLIEAILGRIEVANA